MYTRGNNLNTVSERLVDALLSDNFFVREKMIERVQTILKSWVKVNDKPRDYNKIKTDKGKLVRTIEQKDIEMRYWMNEVRKIKTKDEMTHLYLDLNFELYRQGFLKK